jgi:biotin carboxyl carrier protein
MAEPVLAPMLGKILRLAIQPGERVEEDDTVLVMEAMKMEIEVAAPAAGRLTEFTVAPGDAVDADAVLGYIETD